MTFNKVILLGHLTANPELRYTPKGTAITQFTIALNEKWTDRDGELHEKTVFVDAEAWDKRAESLASGTSKGSPLFIEGKLALDTWEDKKTGGTRRKLKVTVESFRFLDSKTDPEETSASAPSTDDGVPF